MEQKMTKISVINSFEELVAQLRTVFESDAVDVDHVQEILNSYTSDPNEWKKFAHFDKHRYTRNLVDKGNGKYNLMLLCWSEGQSSSIHDHSNAHCFMKMLSGSLHEIKYEWPDIDKCGQEVVNNYDTQYEMKVLEENQLKINEVAYINDSIGLHRVENRSHTYPAVSMHLYVPPYSKCQTFDPRTGHRNECRVTFFSKYGSRTPFKSKPSNSGNNFSERAVVERIG